MKFGKKLFLFCLFINYALSLLCDDLYILTNVSKLNCTNANVTEMDSLAGKECCKVSYTDLKNKRINTCGAIQKNEKIIQEQIKYLEQNQYKKVSVKCLSPYITFNCLLIIIFIILIF
jgi:hypothetical protein